MKVEGDETRNGGTSSYHDGSEGGPSLITPNGFGPGKYVRRLNGVETELSEVKAKYISLESRYAAMQDWKQKLDTWLLDSFGIAINSSSKTVVEGAEGNEDDLLGNQFPVTPILIPKTEQEESTELLHPLTVSVDRSDVRQRNGQTGPSRNHSSVSRNTNDDEKNMVISMDMPKVVINTSVKYDKQRGSDRLSNKIAHRAALKTNKTVPSGSEPIERQRETTGSFSDTIFIRDNISIEVTRTPSIELERCDDTSIHSSPERITLPHPRPIILAENDGTNGGDDDEISIVFASPSPLKSVKPYQMNQIMERMVQNIPAPDEILIPEVLLSEGDQDRQKFFHLETNDPTPCAVCGVIDPAPYNEMVFCDACSLCVHQTCYGVPHLPLGGWKCSPCAAGLNPSEIQCYFCPGFGGALKPVKSPSRCHWAHMSCALWIPEVNPENFRTLEPIVNVSKIPKDRWKLKCSLCKSPRGACIQCQYNKRCAIAFHVTCAMKHGLEMKEVISADESQGLMLHAFCKAHTYKAKPGQGTNTKKRRSSSKGGIESPAKKKIHTSLRNDKVKESRTKSNAKDTKIPSPSQKNDIRNKNDRGTPISPRRKGNNSAEMQME